MGRQICVCIYTRVSVCARQSHTRTESGTLLMAPLNGFLICLLNGDLLWVHRSSTKLNVLPLLFHTPPCPTSSGWWVYFWHFLAAQRDPTWSWQKRSTQSERMTVAVKSRAQGGDAGHLKDQRAIKLMSNPGCWHSTTHIQPSAAPLIELPCFTTTLTKKIFFKRLKCSETITMINLCCC